MEEIKTINFTILGEPKAKQRPRRSKNGGMYTPDETTSYENWVKTCYINEKNKTAKSGCEIPILKGNVHTVIDCYLSIPKSFSKKKTQQCLDGDIRPTKKPDTDNIAKIILDSLNTIAYEDDKQVVSLFVRKFYGATPRVEVMIREI